LTSTGRPERGVYLGLPYFKQVIGVSAKVTNGINADGSEILFDSTKNSKDAWFDADYWFGPTAGLPS